MQVNGCYTHVRHVVMNLDLQDRFKYFVPLLNNTLHPTIASLY